MTREADLGAAVTCSQASEKHQEADCQGRWPGQPLASNSRCVCLTHDTSLLLLVSSSMVARIDPLHTSYEDALQEGCPKCHKSGEVARHLACHLEWPLRMSEAWAEAVIEFT